MEDRKLTESEKAILEGLVNQDNQVEAKYLWDEDFQRVLLGLLLTDRFFLCQSLGLVKPSYFTSEIHQQVCRVLLNYFEKYKTLPSKIFVKQEISDKLRDRYQSDNQTYQAVKLLYYGELTTLYDYYSKGGVGDILPGLDSSDAVLHKITSFAKTQAMKVAFHACLDLIRKNPESDETWDKVNSILKEALLVERQTDLGLNYFETIDERYDRLSHVVETADSFTSGFETIDRGLQGGGLFRGELAAWMGLPGSGKTHMSGTPILMYDGTIKKVEDVQVGDLVMGDDSTPRRVLHVHQLIDRVYEVRPIKGNSYFVNSKHILSLKNSYRQGMPHKDRPTKRRKNPPFCHRMGDTNIFNISVEDWFKQSKYFRTKMKGWRTGVDWNEQSVSIDPYVLGLWLGDGGKAQLTNVDPEVIRIWMAYGRKIGVTCKTRDAVHHNFLVTEGERLNRFATLLRQYNLLNNKHIPHNYKVNSRKNRLAILAGILDADGYYSHGNYKILQKSEVLARDILFLARSLGFAAYMSKGCKKSQNGTEGIYCRVTISGNCDEIPMRINYKKSSPRRQIKNHLMTGINIIAHDYYAGFYGFETDGNHLYLLGDFTVVHNSLALVVGSVKNLARGRKVLYISTEMDSDRIATRFDAQFTLIGQHELIVRREEVKRALLDEVRDYDDKRRLVIKQFPSGTADVNTIRAFHSQCVMHGFRPDIVIVDYPGDMKHSTHIPLHQSLQRALTDLRGFGAEEGHLTLIAIQPNRGASELGLEEFLDESKQAESFGQNRVLDAFWTLNQTTTEQKACVGRVFVAKARNGKSRFCFRVRYGFATQTLTIDEVSEEFYKMALLRVKDTDSDTTETIIDRVVTGGTRTFQPTDGERIQ